MSKIRITKEFDDICYERIYETHGRVFVILMNSTKIQLLPVNASPVIKFNMHPRGKNPQHPWPCDTV